MGRELKRVALDFDWPINETWAGYLNPYHTATKCVACDGSGYSPTGKHLHNQWYGYVPFKPEDRGSVPFKPTDDAVLAFARRNVTHAPDYYGRDAKAVDREARRLCGLFNSQWSHHLNNDDVAALIASHRLHDLTHTFEPGKGWQPKVPAYVPSAREVNVWSIGGLSHDSINAWCCIKAECARLGADVDCPECHGNGEVWPSKAAEALYEAWKPTEPPSGDGYQIWQTVSEGSPISPVFATPEELAAHMATTRWGADSGTPYETWLKFINGPGWSPSMVSVGGEIVDGVTAVTETLA